VLQQTCSWGKQNCRGNITGAFLFLKWIYTMPAAAMVILSSRILKPVLGKTAAAP